MIGQSSHRKLPGGGVKREPKKRHADERKKRYKIYLTKYYSGYILRANKMIIIPILRKAVYINEIRKRI